MSGSSRPVQDDRGLRAVALRCGALSLLVLGYWVGFGPLHAALGNSAFLFGLIPCLAAAWLLGVRGALITIAVIAAMDRSAALALPGPETGRTAGIVAVLVKLLLGGGLGLVIDSRRRIRALNARLREEIEAGRLKQESLQHGESLYRALVESLGEGVGLFDAADRVVFGNQALATTLRVSREDLAGRRFSDLSIERSGAGTGARRSSGETVRCYEVGLASDESTLLLVTETKLEPGPGRDAMTLRVIRDLTGHVVSERRQRDLERELQRSQALQSLAVMAGGVAHDFNNLLCGVVGNAQVAQRKVPPDAPPLLSHCLGEILGFAGEAAQLSRQMLAYAGRRSLSIEALDPNLELSAALRLLHATVESRALLALDLGEGIPEVAADRFQLRQVVTNLVLNALDAMDGKRGRLTLRTESVWLDATRAERYEVRAGSYVKISVEDTGSGVVEEARQRLFEPFFSTKAPGRGMGLAAAAGIVKAHRGWLGIDATSEAGTRFGILWPVARETTPRRAQVPASPAAPPPGRNVLLIDDEPAVRLVTSRLLCELGQRVMTADSGRRGLELFREQPQAIDLVVLDLTMPEQSGEQVLDELRRLRQDVPVVITSGFQAADASRLLRAPNVVGFLDKPHTLTNLEMLLASVDLGRRDAVAGAGGPASTPTH